MLVRCPLPAWAVTQRTAVHCSVGDEGRRGEGGAGGKDLTAVAVDGKEDDEEANSGARLYLQIGRPSYLERNLKLAYLRLDIPPHRFKSNGMVQNI